MSTTKLTARNPSGEWLFLKTKQNDSECFPVSNGVCTSFLSSRASRNYSKGTLLDGVANHSDIFIFYNNRPIYWACAVRKNMAFIVYG